MRTLNNISPKATPSAKMSDPTKTLLVADDDPPVRDVEAQVANSKELVVHWRERSVVSQSTPHHNFFEIASFEQFNYRCAAAPSSLSDQAAPITKGFGAENK